MDTKLYLSEHPVIFIFGTRPENNVQFPHCKFKKSLSNDNRYSWTINLDKSWKSMPCGIYKASYLNGALFTFYVAIWNNEIRMNLLKDHLYKLSCRLFDKPVDNESEIISSQVLDRSWIYYGDQSANLYHLYRKKRTHINFRSIQNTVRDKFQKDEEIYITISFDEDYLKIKKKKLTFLHVETCLLVDDRFQMKNPIMIIELSGKDFLTINSVKNPYKRSHLISFNSSNKTMLDNHPILVKCIIRLCENSLWCSTKPDVPLPRPNVEFEVLKKKLIIINTIQSTQVEFIDVHKDQFGIHKCPSFVCLTNIQVLLIILTTSLISIFFIISLSALLVQIFKNKTSDISKKSSVKDHISDYIDLKCLPDINNPVLHDDPTQPTVVKDSRFYGQDALVNLKHSNQIKLFNIITAGVSSSSTIGKSTEIYV